MRPRRSLLLAGLALWMALGRPSLAAPPLQGGGIHVVQAGDTLTQIALRYGVSVADLVAANRLANPNLILVGQRLVITPTQAVRSGSTMHVVQAGETVSLISQRYQVSIAALIAANRLADPNYIVAGQQLAIPGEAQEAQLPIPFLDVHLTPSPAQQGQTVVIRVRMVTAARVRGTLLGQEFDFVADSPGGREGWALVGVPALTARGQYPLSLTAEGYEPGINMWLRVLPGDFGTDYIQLSPETRRLLDPALIRAEWARLNRHWSHLRPSKLWQAPFTLPVASGTRVSSPFGRRRSYNGQPARSYHEGIDFAAPKGTPVYAPAAGRVVLAEELTVRGNGVLIDHGWGVVSGYFHLSRTEVKVGQEVGSGDLIGRVGSTGLSTGNHLHWEIRVRAVPVDPHPWTVQVIP